MFGDAMLVAPYLEEGDHERSLYLPNGDWYHFFDHQLYQGGQEIVVESSHWYELPVFVKAGIVVPLTLGKNSPVPGKSYFKAPGTKQYENEAIKGFRVYPKADGTLVQDDFVSGLKVRKYKTSLEVWTSNDKAAHIEVLNTERPGEVTLNNQKLKEAFSWEEMMEAKESYYYDKVARKLYCHN